MSWDCPECDSANPEGLVKCSCGHMQEETKEPSASLSKTDHDNSYKSCPSCAKEIPSDDTFCSFCGKSARTLSEKEKKSIKKASNWILGISIMFLIAGTVLGMLQRSEAQKAYDHLAQFENSEVLEPIDGIVYTVEELRSEVKKEVIFAFGLNYFLAIVMFSLYLWARRSPFPAMVTALCVYLALIALNGILDPNTLAQGFLIKAIFIAALVAGIKASLAARSVVMPA